MDALSLEAIVLAAFLRCDASFYTALAAHAPRVAVLKPLRRNAAGVTHLAVKNRLEEDDNSMTLKPAFIVDGVVFDEFVDDETVLQSTGKHYYMWGFNTTAPVKQVLPVVQKLLEKPMQLQEDTLKPQEPKDEEAKSWVRLSLWEADKKAWIRHARPRELVGKPASAPELALIVQPNEGEGTRVMCSLQTAHPTQPLPNAELRRLRPDID